MHCGGLAIDSRGLVCATEWDVKVSARKRVLMGQLAVRKEREKLRNFKFVPHFFTCELFSTFPPSLLIISPATHAFALPVMRSDGEC